MVLGTVRRAGHAGRPSCSTCHALHHESSGATLIELLAVLAIISSAFGIGLPFLTNGADARRTRDAASFLAGKFRLARQRAVMTGHNVAVVFDAAGEFTWRICEDRDRDGLSRSDIVSGTDRCEDAGQPLSQRFPGVVVGYGVGVPSPDNVLNASPVGFGLTDMAVFTPMGTASAGTVAVSGAGGNQFAVRVSGVTGRTRVLRFDPGSRVWTD